MPDTPARRRRRIRRTVAAASLATFALTWGVIAGTGSMGASTPTAASSAPDGSAATPYDRTPDQSGGSDRGFDRDRGSFDQGTQSPDLTTRQS